VSAGLVIGLTGGMASGKTTVAAMLRQCGCRVLDVDRVGHQALAKKTPCYRKLIQAFGREICDTAGRIDRRRLAEAAFKNKAKYGLLCRIVHPWISKRLAQEVVKFRQQRQPGILVLEAAMLLEAGWHSQVDQVVLVIAGRLRQLQRVRRSERMSLAQARQRLAFQWPDGRKRQYADHIIENCNTVTDTRRQVRRLWRHWQDRRDGP